MIIVDKALNFRIKQDSKDKKQQSPVMHNTSTNVDQWIFQIQSSLNHDAENVKLK